MHILQRETTHCEIPSLGSSVHIVDEHALLQSIVSLPENFKQLTEQVFTFCTKLYLCILLQIHTRLAVLSSWNVTSEVRQMHSTLDAH